MYYDKGANKNDVAKISKQIQRGLREKRLLKHSIIKLIEFRLKMIKCQFMK